VVIFICLLSHANVLWPAPPPGNIFTDCLVQRPPSGQTSLFLTPLFLFQTCLFQNCLFMAGERVVVDFGHRFRHVGPILRHVTRHTGM
jgi:hypothetical protein